jgi:hypothetical protein
MAVGLTLEMIVRLLTSRIFLLVLDIMVIDHLVTAGGFLVRDLDTPTCLGHKDSALDLPMAVSVSMSLHTHLADIVIIIELDMDLVV